MSYENRGVFPFDPSESALVRSLEEEDRQSMKEDERQVQLKEYLARTLSDDIDADALDSEWRNQREDEREQQTLFGWLHTQATTDSYTGDSSFWLQPTNKGHARSLKKVDEIKENAVLKKAPERVVVERRDRAAAPATSNAYEAAQWVINNEHVISSGGTLYFYTDKCYQAVTRDEAKRLILDACRADVKTSGSDSFVKRVYSLLVLEPRIVRDSKLLQRNIIAFDDIVLDLDTWQMYDHTPDIFVTTRLKASYQEGCQAQCPVFERFLESATKGDTVLQQRIWEAMGYLLAPDQKGKVFILLQGVSHSGKSVLGEFVRDSFVGDVVSPLEINDLSGNFVLSDLVGKKLCLDLDLPADPFSKRAVSKLKKLTGGDFVSSDVKFADRVRFACTAKFLFASNHAVLLPNKDDAFNNRLVVIPFGVSVPKEKQDFFLREKLAQERSAIVVRALWAYKGLGENSYRFAGYYPPNAALDDDSATPLDSVVSFVQQECMVSEGEWTATADLHAAFTATYGIDIDVKTFSKLFMRVCTMFNFSVTKARSRLDPGMNPVYGFLGIELKG